MCNSTYLPEQPEDVTSEWLTQILRNNGTLHKATVSSIQIESLGTFSSKLWRLQLEYDVVEDEAPLTLVLKQPLLASSGRPGSGFANEVHFYRDIAHRLSVHTPRFYFGHVNAATGDAMLLLEDVRDVVPIDWQRGVTAHHARLATEALASLHAAWWDNVEHLDALPHLADTAFRSQIAQAYDRGWQASRDYFKANYDGPFITIGDALVGNVEASLVDMGTPATILHGDAHFENIVILRQDDTDNVLFMDWADTRRGLASFDVAVFAVQSYPTPDRRRKEESLVATHAAAVRSAGVHDWPDPWLDYRRGMLYWVIHMIQNAALRPGDATSIVIERYVAAAIDLRIHELIC